jgi:hypothetical protein
MEEKIKLEFERLADNDPHWNPTIKYMSYKYFM